MDVDSDNESPAASTSMGAKEKKRFEVKKWNAVALWAWDIVVDNCAICRNHIMELCIECQVSPVGPDRPVRAAPAFAADAATDPRSPRPGDGARDH